jgi:phytoene dehydrogenase-like protein
MDEIEQAFQEAAQGKPSSRPIMEMVIPTSLDDSIGNQYSNH